MNGAAPGGLPHIGKRWSRRRVLLIAAAACGLPFTSRSAGSSSADAPPTYSWRGSALGAPAQITLQHPDPRSVRRTIQACLGEIARLDAVFSLHNERSEIVRLNRSGYLRQPSLDLRILMEQSQWLGHITDGAFDVTVQPLWQLYAQHFREADADRRGPTHEALARVRGRIDYQRIDIGSGAIGFLKSGMAATLNGIAQGAITDRIADILKNESYDRVLVNIGEIAALEPPANTTGWQVRIDDPVSPGQALGRVRLANRAIATSSGHATRFDASGDHHHLFDPTTGRSAARHRSVSVIASTAALSDALSTALSVLPADRAAAVLRDAGAEKALLVTPAGTATWIAGA